MASWEAWAHAECGLSYRDMADYTPQELNRLQLGYLIREKRQQASGSRSSSNVHSRKAELQEGRHKARQDLLDEINGLH